MRFRFILGISLAVVVGLFFANGVVNTGEYLFKFIKSNSHAVYQSASDLGARSFSDLDFVDLNILNTKNESKGSGIYHLYPNASVFPNISAESYLIADIDSGQLIKQKNRGEQYSIASLTKLMTALVSLETLDQQETSLVSYRAVNTYGKQGGLYSGQKILVGDLIYPLLLESSNDAAEVLAEHSGWKFFVANMNGKSKSIGLNNTSFVDPSGLSPQNVSTADDLFKMTQYLNRNKQEVLEITRLKNYKSDEIFWYNMSDFRNDENYLGGKNGYIDESLHTLIAIFALPLAGDPVEDGIKEKSKNSEIYKRIAIILLKSDNAEKDTRQIIYWLLENVYYK